MINRRELNQLTSRAGVSEKAQEKDYVLTWLLAARAEVGWPELVFKGGTALRKCYYADYRYSEDLDFTSVGQLSLESLLPLLDSWFDFVRKSSGIEARLDDGPRIEVDSFTGYASYRAVLGGERSIKIDVTNSEIIFDKIEHRQLISEYSDISGAGVLIETYSLVEIFAEKVRSLVQRTQPRDVYDLVEVLEREPEVPSHALAVYEKKMKYKSIPLSQLSVRLDEAEKLFERLWKNQLASHVPNLRPFGDAWRKMRRNLRENGYLG